MVKTTIQVDDDLWKKFSHKVIEVRGGRCKNDVIVEFITAYVNSTE